MRLRAVFAVLICALVGAIGLPTAPAIADVPLYTPSLQILTSSYSTGPTFTVNLLESRDALPTYSVTVSDAAGRSLPTQYAYPQITPYSDIYSGFGFQSVGGLTPGTTYKVSLSVATVGYYACSIYDKNGCSWRNAEDNTYQWTFVYSGAPSMTATPYYDPQATTVSIPRNRVQWRSRAHSSTLRATVRMGYPADNILTELAPGRSTVIEGLRGGKWVTLKQLGFSDGEKTLHLRVQRSVRKIRAVVPALTDTTTDGGQVTYEGAYSKSIRAPRQR